jgi:hypothetical protein
MRDASAHLVGLPAHRGRSRSLALLKLEAGSGSPLFELLKELELSLRSADISCSSVGLQPTDLLRGEGRDQPFATPESSLSGNILPFREALCGGTMDPGVPPGEGGNGRQQGSFTSSCREGDEGAAMLSRYRAALRRCRRGWRCGRRRSGRGIDMM